MSQDDLGASEIPPERTDQQQQQQQQQEDEKNDDNDGAFGLDDLFTCTDYATSVIEIPLRSDDDSPTLLRIPLSYSPAASTDYDLTGQIIWPVSRLLAHAVAAANESQRQPSARSRPLRILELGAGTGLPALVAAVLAPAGSQVLLTDGNEVVLELLEQNVRNLRESESSILPAGTSVAAQRLVWGNCEHLQQALTSLGGPVDLVLAADVVQWTAVVEPLLWTLQALLWRGADQEGSSSTLSSTPLVCPVASASPAVIWLGIVNRANSTYRLFWDLAEAMGFEHARVDASEIFPPDAVTGETIVPSTCRESGDRTAEIHRLWLHKDWTARVPALLQTETSRDTTVGTSYEQTAFLPY
jgi:hypothetical protein